MEGRSPVVGARAGGWVWAMVSGRMTCSSGLPITSLMSSAQLRGGALARSLPDATVRGGFGSSCPSRDATCDAGS